MSLSKRERPTSQCVKAACVHPTAFVRTRTPVLYLNDSIPHVIRATLE